MIFFNETKKYYLVVFLFMASFYGCGQNKINNLERDGFSIKYPSYFELDESGEQGTTFILKTKPKNSENSFIENVNLIIEINSKKIDFKEHFIKVEKEISELGKIIKKKIFKPNNNVLRLVFKLSQGNKNYTFIQQVHVHENKIYTLTFSSDSAEFDNYFDEVSKMFSSFKVK